MNSRTVQVVAAFGLALAYCVGTYSQQIFWSSDLLIFARGNSLYPNSYYAAMGFAKELTQRGGYDRARELAENALKIKPNVGLAYLLLAEINIKNGQKENARALINKGLAADPTILGSEVGKIDMAGMYGELGDYDSALALCKSVLLQEPDLYSAQYNCGNIDLMAGHYAEAESLLARAITADPGQANPYFFLGRVYMQTDRPESAEMAFRKAISLSPTVYDFHYWYGKLLAQRGEIPSARREISAALALNSESSEVKAALASLPTVQ